MACPRSLHPSVRILSGCKIVVRCVNVSCCCGDRWERGPTSSCVFCWFNLMPMGLPSSSKRLINHATSCRSMNRLVSSMNELVCGAGMFEVVVCREMISLLIFLSSRERTMAAKLPLSGQPCANPSRCRKCLYVPLSVLCQHLLGSL